MTIKELSQKYSVFWLGSAVVLLIISIVLSIYVCSGSNYKMKPKGEFPQQQEGRMMKNGNNFNGIDSNSNSNNINEVQNSSN